MKRREHEAVRMEMDKYYAEQRAYDQSAGDPLRDDIKRMGRQAKERQQEAQMLDAMYQAERNNELALLRAEEEERLATVLARRQHEVERSQREVQQLREQSEELRALAEKIRTARVNKERAEQLRDNAQLKAQQQEYDTTFNLYVQRSEAAAAAQEAEALAKRKAMAIKAREVLEEQMAERQDLLKIAEEQAIRERAMVDQVVARIAEENNAEATLRAAKVQETKAFIAQFLEQQEAARRAREARDKAEEQKRLDHWTMVREREAEEAARKAERKAEADRLYEKVRVEMEAANRAREEEEDLINLLRQEEAEAKRRADEEEAKRKAEQMRREMQLANEYQMRLKAQREAQLKADEEAFKATMMARFAEEDRIEQMNAQKRRMRQLEHAREVQRMVDDRRRLYQEQKAREEAEIAAQSAEEARKQVILEAERQKLLAEAAELKDYLPRGVLRDQADIDYINSVLAGTSLNGR